MLDEKFITFKRLYVTAKNQIREIEQFSPGSTDEQLVKQVIEHTDTMLSMLPMEFPTQSLAYANARILLVDLADPKAEPEEIVEKGQGYTTYKTPANTDTLYENTILTVLENWKFTAWNYFVHFTTDVPLKDKYIPLVMTHAVQYMERFPHGSYWQQWEKDMYVLYANQFGWFTYEKEQDTEKLEAALAVVEKGYEHGDWSRLNFIYFTKVSLLLKLNRPQEAYPIVREGLTKAPSHVEFQELKKDPAYLSWLTEQEVRDKQAAAEKQKAKKAFLRMIKDEQAKVTNQFVNPQHPLIVQHSDALNLIKQRMIEMQLRKLYEDDYKTRKGEPGEGYELRKWSVEEIEQFEKDTKLRLPDELKVYLLEIGEGGDSYFCYGGINVSWLTSNDKELKQVRKAFPITEDKIHDINHWWGVKAWVYPDDTDWVDEGIIDEDADMEVMFGLPAKANMTDGCFPLGDSSSQDPLLLIMNGVFEGEVWVDTLQYGAEAGGCFAPATADKMKFLAFVAASILAHKQGYTDASDQGSWM